MKIKNLLIFLYYFILLFVFAYTLPININLEKKINIINMVLMFFTFLIWSISWYLFFVKDILKSDEKERSRITLVLVLLGILFFYYNPLPFPDNYYMFINRNIYFFITLLAFFSFVKLSYKKNFFAFTILVFIPIIINSFFVNILNKTFFFDKYPYFTFCFIGILLTSYYGYKILTKK